MAIIKTTDSDRLDFDSAINELKEYFSSLGARKGRNLTYNVLTYGCQLNESDSEKLSGMLASMGLTPCLTPVPSERTLTDTCLAILVYLRH